MKQRNSRFAFIEAMLIHHGCIRRSHLKRAYDLQDAAATKIFREYIDQYPKAMNYDRVLKRYIANKVKPIHLKTHGDDASAFLSAIEIVAGQSIVELEIN